MVIIKEDNTTPLEWPLGRITKIHKGDDGFVRVADIKTSNGTCRRPIARIAPLPINAEETHDPDQSNDKNRDESTGPLPLKNANKITFQENKPEIPNKKRRKSINHNVLAILMTLMLLPLAIGAKFKIHNLKHLA